VFEDEPDTKPGLLDCENVVAVPHIASASFWTRAGMVSVGGICTRRRVVGIHRWSSLLAALQHEPLGQQVTVKTGLQWRRGALETWHGT
jgi:hydroxypyruvate reductase 1